MAEVNSGIVYSSYGRNSRVYVSWRIAETDILSNRWRIEWEAGVEVENDDYWYSNAVRINSIYIDGGDSLGKGIYSNILGTGTYPKLSGSKWVNAKADGSKKITVSISGWFYDYGSRSGKKEFSITAVPRNATLVTAPDFSDELMPSITYSNPAAEAVSDLDACISFDGRIDHIPYRDVSKTEGSYTFVLTDEEKETLNAACQESSSVSVQFILRTKIGSNTYYSSLARRFTISNAKPIITASVEDTNPATIFLTGDSRKLIRFYSNAKAVMSAEAQKGASIDESRYVIKNGGSSVQGTSYTFENIESNEFVFSAEDSRGSVSSVTLTPEIVEYVKPTCNIMNTRPDALGNMTVACSGNYFNGFFGAIANTLTVKYRYKELNGSFCDWISMTVTKNGNGYAATASLSGLDYERIYTFEVSAADYLCEVTSANPMVKGVPVFHWGENDFVFEVPVILKAGAVGLDEGNSGSWTPSLDSDAVSYYTAQYGWYMKTKQAVTIGFFIKAACKAGFENTSIYISDLPFTPLYSAAGGGMCSGAYIGGGYNFQCFVAEINGFISTRIQGCNSTAASNIPVTSGGCCYPSGGGELTLCGTITFMTES